MKAPEKLFAEIIDYKYRGKVISTTGTWIKVPITKGQDTLIFWGWSREKKNQQKCVLPECDSKNAKFIQTIVEKADELDIHTPIWGKQVKLTNVANSGSSQCEYAGNVQIGQEAHQLPIQFDLRWNWKWKW